jgi:hypothetical protein
MAMIANLATNALHLLAPSNASYLTHLNMKANTHPPTNPNARLQIKALPAMGTLRLPREIQIFVASPTNLF